MIDHSSFDHNVDVIREECLEWDRITSLLISMMSMDREFMMRNPRFSHRFARLEKKYQECREIIEQNVFNMIGHHLLACDDCTPWIHSENREAKNSEEWTKKRHGSPYITTDTQIRLDNANELYKERKDRVAAERTVKELQEQIDKLKSELESQKASTEDFKRKYEHTLDALADPDIH